MGDGISMEDKSKLPMDIRNIFWQTSINDQRPKLRLCINNILIQGLLDTGTDVTIIIPKS